MKKITKSFLLVAFLAFSSYSAAQCTYYEFLNSSTPAGYSIVADTDIPNWTASEWYNIIDIDAAQLTDVALPKFTASDGKSNALDTDFGSGYFLTPIYTQDADKVKTATGLQWPVKYFKAAFAPTMYGSAHTKIVDYGTNASGTGCFLNDNSLVPRDVYNKQGFIELCRLKGTAYSNHGYIEIDSLPSVERIQWSYSGTSWKRGVKADINYNDGTGWQPLRWEASDISNSIATFAERGYQYEEKLNLQSDPSSLISFRIYIWDGDSIHANPLKDQTNGLVPFNPHQYPLAQYQTVRVHQIKIFSGVVPETAPTPVVPGSLYVVPAGLKSVVSNGIKIHVSNNKIVLSDTAPVELYSIDGRKLYKGLTDKVDVSAFSRGTYIIRTTNSSGLSQNTKIIL